MGNNKRRVKMRAIYFIDADNHERKPLKAQGGFSSLKSKTGLAKMLILFL
jgi:hypothetical protein